MSDISSLFVTRLYRAKLSEHGKPIDPDELEATCLSIAEDDEAGQAWCEENDFPGYTILRVADGPAVADADLQDAEEGARQACPAFAADLAFDLGDKKLKLEDLWINILPEGGIHTAHIHPHSVISGTTYVAMPQGHLGDQVRGSAPADDDGRPRPPKRAQRRRCASSSMSPPTWAMCCCGKAGCVTRCR